MGGTNLRLLGVHGRNAPTVQSRTVQPADFAIAGLIVRGERQYEKTFTVNDMDEYRRVFGENFNAAFYGFDSAEKFFDNLVGSEASLIVKSHVGYDGASIDGVVASGNQLDCNGLNTAIALANALKATMNTHAADAVEHSTADTINFPITVDDAMDAASLIELVSAMMTAYTAHDNDVLLGTPAFHVATSTANALANTAAPTSVAEAITRLNDLKAKYNLHDTNSTSHTTGGTHQEATSDASGSPVNTVKIEAAYQEELDYGSEGNRTGYQFTHTTRFETTLAATVAAGASTAVLDSVIGMKVGDIVVFRATGGGGAIIQKAITAIDEGTKTITFAAPFHGSATGNIGDTVRIPGFTLRTYRKTPDGISQEQETLLAPVILTMESGVTASYLQSVHKENTYIKVSDLASASTLLESFPDSNSSPVFLTGGANGTSPSVASHWDLDVAAFANDPIRMIANPETSDKTIMKDLELKMGAREDTPILIATIPIDQTKNQLETLGNEYQRSDSVFQVNVHEWVEIDDSFNSAPNAPDRQIPNVGPVMGAWIRSIATQGIHYIPSTDQITLRGINGIVNTNLGNVGDQDRTDIAESGVNIIQFIEGSGFRIRNFYTPSTGNAERFANAILMRNFIKISAADSLKPSENTPNSFNRIKEDREAIRGFLLTLWFRGSNGFAPEGETFGQQENADGTLTTPFDHFEVKADAINNPLESINLGRRNFDIKFTFPTPAGSIFIDVALLIRSTNQQAA